jgi:hypothetical protein
MSIAPVIKDPKLLGESSRKLFVGSFKASVKKLLKKHNSKETAVPFFLDTACDFKDAQEEFFFIFGKIKAWKAHAKKTANEKMATRGFCYATAEGKTITIHLMPVAGKAKNKIDLIGKKLKTVISPGKICMVIDSGEFDENDPKFLALEESVEQMPDAPDEADEDQDEEDEAPSSSSPDAAPDSKQIPAELAKIKQLLVEYSKNKSPENLAKIEQIYQQFNQLISLFPGGIQKTAKEHELYKTVEKILENAKKAKPEEPKPNDAPSPQEAAQKEQMAKAMGEFKSLFAELGIAFEA